MKFLLLLCWLITCVNTLHIKGINLFGLEGEHFGFMCDWVHPVEFYVKELHGMGFNTLRIPFSYEYYLRGNLQDMDTIVALAYRYNMSIILDFHRVWSDTQPPTPYIEGMSINAYHDMWLSLAYRYNQQPSVKMIDIFNEFVPDDVEGLASFSINLWNKLETALPGRYLYLASGIRWSADFYRVNYEDLLYHEHIYYSVHKYPFSYMGRNASEWDASFGNVRLPPRRVILGEFGWPEDDKSWAQNFLSYLQEKGYRHSVFWSLSQSGDTYDLYDDDCVTLHDDVLDVLHTFWSSG